MADREPIPAAFWWQSAGNDFDKVIREFLTRAQNAEQREKGHECGHRFEITIRSSLHASGPGEHTDVDYFDDTKPVTVRAHNLRDALLIAASLPLSGWFEDAGPAGLTEDGQANDCTHGSATGIDMTSPRDPAKVWRCDHCGLRWRSDGAPLVEGGCRCGHGRELHDYEADPVFCMVHGDNTHCDGGGDRG